MGEVDRPGIKQTYRFETIEEILNSKVDTKEYLKQLSIINTSIKSGASDDYISRQLLILERISVV